MALLEKHRNTVYNAFVPLLGEEVTEAVLAHFPARDVEEMVTKEHLDRRFAEQNAEFDRKLDQLRAEFDRKLDEVRADINALRLDTARQINELRVDVAHQVAAESDKTFHRMLTLAGIGLGMITMLFAAFT